MKKKNSKSEYIIAVTPKDLLLTEQFKGEIPEKQAQTFQNRYGEQHPFDFEQMEHIYEKFGVATGVTDKYVDFIVGPGFFINCKDKKAKTIIEQFLQDQNFDIILRKWVKQALIKGNSPLEIGVEKKAIIGLKVLNADNIFVKRDNKGEILQYTQVIKNRGANSKEIIFKPEEISMLQFNVPDDNTYGLGILYPALSIINNILGCEKDMHMLIKRKANSPIHIQLGNMDKDDIPTDEDLTNFGQKLEYLTNKQEWATGPNVNMKVIDFGNIGGKFDNVLDYDTQSLFYALQVPEVLMGKGNIPEGLANVQLDAWMRRVQSFQAEIEKHIETNIFDTILKYNGLAAHVEFEWEQPSNAETNERITKITTILTNVMLDQNLRVALEKELAELLGVEVDVVPAEERAGEEEQPLPKIPGQENVYIGELIFA